MVNEFFKIADCIYRFRSPHPSARLYSIKFFSFRCSHPPSPQWEGLVGCKFARGLCVHIPDKSKIEYINLLN